MPPGYNLQLNLNARNASFALKLRVTLDVALLHKIREDGVCVVADAHFPGFAGVLVAKLGVDGFIENDIRMNGILCVFHHFNALKQVGFQWDGGGIVVDGRVQQRDGHAGKLTAHFRVGIKRGILNDLVELRLFAVDDAGHFVERQEIALNDHVFDGQGIAVFVRDEVRGVLLGQINGNGEAAHFFQLAGKLLKELLVHSGVLLARHGVVEHGDGKHGAAALQQACNAVQDALIVRGEHAAAVYAHVLWDVERHGGAHGRCAARANLELILAAQLRELVRDGVHLHDIRLRADGLQRGQQRRIARQRDVEYFADFVERVRVFRLLLGEHLVEVAEILGHFAAVEVVFARGRREAVHGGGVRGLVALGVQLRQPPVQLRNGGKALRHGGEVLVEQLAAVLLNELRKRRMDRGPLRPRRHASTALRQNLTFSLPKRAGDVNGYLPIREIS